ncbi:hypothetical protein G6F68_013974 [Rhizopus microsporus]|nr:hypothetical protein G6F68_013974 [Rhizopus microsporus]
MAAMRRSSAMPTRSPLPCNTSLPACHRPMADNERLPNRAGLTHGSGYQRPLGTGLRRKQGVGPGLRACAGARGRQRGDRGPWRGGAAARGRGTACPARRCGCPLGRRRCHHRGRSRCGTGRVPAGGHPGHQRRWPAAGRFPQLRARRLDRRAGRQHAGADRTDPRHRGRDDRSRLWPHRQHHLLGVA